MKESGSNKYLNKTSEVIFRGFLPEQRRGSYLKTPVGQFRGAVLLRHPYFVIDLTKFGNLSTGHIFF
ncbi:hypothetical protein [Xenorhabdus bovienii]|uniref:hypothetical protein n=1 Tax=Xenorhabdus bovienii TaxID=40576 RepID=UPI000B084ECD|nr:hypothetical protein [Xenorhabdus bovienii]